MQVVVTLRNILTGETESRTVDVIVVERGTAPMDELYTELKDESVNQGVTEINALIQAKPQPFADDVISSRGIHEAIRDSLRLGLTL